MSEPFGKVKDRFFKAVKASDISSVFTIVFDNIDIVHATDTEVLLRTVTAQYTALHYAAKNGDREMCDVLLDLGARVNGSLAQNPTTPILLAVDEGHHDCVVTLDQ